MPTKNDCVISTCWTQRVRGLPGTADFLAGSLAEAFQRGATLNGVCFNQFPNFSLGKPPVFQSLFVSFSRRERSGGERSWRSTKLWSRSGVRDALYLYERLTSEVVLMHWCFFKI